MKNIAFVFLFMFALVQTQAQDKSYPWGVSFKSLFMDYQSQNGGSIDAIKDYHSGFEIGLHRRIQENVSLVIPFKYGNVNEGDFREDLSIHKRVAGLDAQIQYQFQKPEAVIVPYFFGGLGGVLEFEGEFNVQAPIGAGLFFKAGKNAYVNWQSEYRFSFSENRNNLHHGIGFVYLIGKQDMEEKPMVEAVKTVPVIDDMDGDGIPDDLDLCPDQVGPKALNGCPDSDGDGIADFQDKCPDVAGTKTHMGCLDSDGDGIADPDDDCPHEMGLASNRGCPESDRDGDGIVDTEDVCPDEAGTFANNGCPESDRDGDGINDDEDGCPDQFGPRSNNGCPVNDNDNDGVPNSIDRCPDAKGPESTQGCPDSDGDGVADIDDRCPNKAGPKVYDGCPDTDGDGLDDSRDRCPNTPGTVAANGCPEISKEDKKTLDIAMRAVQFDTGKNTLKSESYQILKQIANIMNRYPDYNLSIAGHTDNVGNASANQELSQKRAEACYLYLISQGVDRRRMSFTGFGESRPIADNNTLNGKSLNRRVEFNLVPR